MSRPPNLLYLSPADVQRCGVTMSEVIDMVELALFEHGQGRTHMPPKLGFHPEPGTLMHAMPAYVAAAKAAGMKWVSAFPNNNQRGLPAVNAIIVLSDPETGLPQAIMDATWITAARTGASAAVAARKFASQDAEVAGVIGPGVIARASVAALRAVLPKLKRVRAYAPNRETLARFASEIREQYGLEVTPTASAAEAAQGANILITSAPWPRVTGQPPLAADAVRDVPFCCVLNLDSTISAAAVAACDRFFADDVATFDRHRSQGFFAGWPVAQEFSHVVADKLPARQGNERVICANLGLGIYDVVVARRVFDRAVAQGIGARLSL